MHDYVRTKDAIYFRHDGWNGTLRKKDLQLFFKRLRHKIPKFSYLACGEYGGETERPHYHAILFGAELPAKTMYNSRIINKEFYWQNKIIEECWVSETGRHGRGESMGFSNVSVANWNTIAYTARYIVKKHKGVYAPEEYAKKGQDPEFITSSKNPAIGKEYFNLHPELMEKDEIIIHNKNGSYVTKRPRYFDKLVAKHDEALLEQQTEQRRQTAKERQAVKDASTTLRRKEQLRIDENSQKEKTLRLKRSLNNK